MPESPEKKKKTKLKGVIPAEVTTAEEFREALENLEEYHRRSHETSTKLSNEFLINLAKDIINQPYFKILADIFEKNPSLLEEVIQEHEQKSSKE